MCDTKNTIDSLGISNDDIVIAVNAPTLALQWHVYWCDFSTVIPGCKTHPALVVSPDEWNGTMPFVKVAMLTSKLISTSNPEFAAANDLRVYVDLGTDRLSCIKLDRFYDVPLSAIRSHMKRLPNDEILESYITQCIDAQTKKDVKAPGQYTIYKKNWLETHNNNKDFVS